ncbi:hypothetical protein C8F01DRAFT_1290682 [Mycena amicta]|nr:hypothetical protein C8F01DRAFT_1290682 [Mycena amicta]
MAEILHSHTHQFHHQPVNPQLQGFATPILSSMSDSDTVDVQPVTKRRGRPKGSKNKPKDADTAPKPLKAKATKDSGAAPTKKKGKKEVLEVGSETDGEEEQLKGELAKIKAIEWTTEPVLQLISECKENDDARERLFLGTGTGRFNEHGKPIPPNTKSKKEAIMLSATIQTDQGKAQWLTKVKNKLDKMQTKFRELAGEMGETGAGITSKEAIDMTKEQQADGCVDFQTHRGTGNVREQAPWFFEYKELIGARPNVIAEGHGNADTAIDFGILRTTTTSDDDAASAATVSDDDEEGSDDGKKGLRAEDEDEEDAELPANVTVASAKAAGTNKVKLEADATKCKCTDSQSAATDEKSKKQKKKAVTETSSRSTGPKPTKSVPAPAAPIDGGQGKANSDRFTEIARAEEETTRKRLDLKRSQNDQDHELRLEKIQISAKYKLESEKHRREMNMQRLHLEQTTKMQMQIRMMELRMRMQAGPSNPGPSFMSSSNIRKTRIS